MSKILEPDVLEVMRAIFQCYKVGPNRGVYLKCEILFSSAKNSFEDLKVKYAGKFNKFNKSINSINRQTRGLV